MRPMNDWSGRPTMVHQDLGDLLDLRILKDLQVYQDFLDQVEHQVVYLHNTSLSIDS